MLIRGFADASNLGGHGLDLHSMVNLSVGSTAHTQAWTAG